MKPNRSTTFLTSTLFALATTMAIATVALTTACAKTPKPEEPAVSATASDPHSFARPDEVAVDHLSLDLTVDFDQKTLSGTALLRLAEHQANRLLLDTRDLEIRSVKLGETGDTEAKFTLGAADASKVFLGRALEIEITPEVRAVRIDYSTSPDAAALQWLTPAQAGSDQPFLFTQSQAILARTWVPCQDTPAVRMTYDAKIKVPAALLAVMSAENPTAKSADGNYSFRMPQRIPSYLLALAVGDLAFRDLGPTSGVYALPSVVEKAKWELADTPKMITAAEGLYGPYAWGRYDLLILPASYPFGGMENPRLTFATPTILAGDRSLVSLVAHELAHSWSGNLVTNSTWNDFWLNEGFTTYFERRIMEEVYGRDFEEMEAALAVGDLAEDIERLGGPEHPDTRLRLDLAGRDPDEGMNDIAYEKGALLLRSIEETVGREAWDTYLRGYFDRHKFQSIDTDGFLADVRKELIRGDAALETKLALTTWIDGPGLPASAPKPQSDAFVKVDAALAALAQGTAPSALDTKGWNTQMWLRFVRGLTDSSGKPSSVASLTALDQAFRFTASGNAEILCAWFEQTIRAGYHPADSALEAFLTSVGRRKFLRPLYAELVKTPEGLAQAKKIYERARPSYHSVSQNTIDAMLAAAAPAS